MTNRVDKVLAEVKDDIMRRREAGEFAVGYVEAFESLHNVELGKLRPVGDSGVAELQSLLDRLRQRIDSLSSIERDHVRFAPVRFVRELAMSRHQLIRLNSEVKAIARAIEDIATQIIATETTRTTANLKAADHLMEVVYERTMVMEKLLVLCREMEQRINSLEQR